MPSDSRQRRWTLLYNYPVSAVVVLCTASWYIDSLYPVLHVVSTDRVMGQVRASLRVRKLGTFSQTLGCSFVLCRAVFIICSSSRKCLYTCKIFTALNIKLHGFYKLIILFYILFYSLPLSVCWIVHIHTWWLYSFRFAKRYTIYLVIFMFFCCLFFSLEACE